MKARFKDMCGCHIDCADAAIRSDEKGNKRIIVYDCPIEFIEKPLANMGLIPEDKPRE